MPAAAPWSRMPSTTREGTWGLQDTQKSDFIKQTYSHERHGRPEMYGKAAQTNLWSRHGGETVRVELYKSTRRPSQKSKSTAKVKNTTQIGLRHADPYALEVLRRSKGIEEMEAQRVADGLSWNRHTGSVLAESAGPGATGIYPSAPSSAPVGARRSDQAWRTHPEASQGHRRRHDSTKPGRAHHASYKLWRRTNPGYVAMTTGKAMYQPESKRAFKACHDDPLTTMKQSGYNKGRNGPMVFSPYLDRAVELHIPLSATGHQGEGLFDT